LNSDSVILVKAKAVGKFSYLAFTFETLDRITMNPAEDCLQYLEGKEWTELHKVLSNDDNASILADHPTFSVFESVFIDEIKRHENESNDDLYLVAKRIFEIHKSQNSKFKLAEKAQEKLTKYLFDKHPEVAYAIHLPNDEKAKNFLIKDDEEAQKRIDNQRLSASLDINVGESGCLVFEKSIFNSPQEKELFLAAQNVLPDSILLPNTALSTIVSPKVCKLLSKEVADFFYKSTLDLCIVNSDNHMPELFIELDSSWHDEPRQMEKDKMKDEIFKVAGLTLERLRKIENKGMIEIFELYIKSRYTD